jgi:acyl-coenzyme A synthetase/AMP-(fatty) acid ligase
MTNIRAALAGDPTVGAGNMLSSLARHGASPDGPGLTFDTAVDGLFPAWHPLTLGELTERVMARAAWLRSHGIRPRDPVAVYTTSAADVFLNYFALTWLGAIPALLNGNVPGDIAEIWISRLRAEGVLCDEEHAARLRATQLDTPILGLVDEVGTGDPGAAPPAYRHDGSDPVSITHSSGTTGVPKAIVHSNDTLFAATRRLRLSVPLAQGTDRVLCALPAAHTAGILSVNQALGNRAELVFLSGQRGGPVLDAIETWRPHGVFGFAVTWAELARFDLSKRDMSSVAIWFNTGDCAHEAHIRRLVAVGSRKTVTREGVITVPGSTFIDGLGSTEMGHSAFHISHRNDTERYDRCIGKPHLFAEVSVVEPDGSPTPPGKVGWLALKSPTVMLGYWNDSVTTYRSQLAGWYITGDLVYTDDDGNYYHMDRTSDAVDLGGGNFLYTALSEERILATCPDIVDCTVSAVRDGGAVVTDVMLMLTEDATGDDPTREDRVRAALGPPVAATVRHIIVVDPTDLPTGATGKIRKLVLRARYLAGAPGAAS